MGQEPGRTNSNLKLSEPAALPEWSAFNGFLNWSKVRDACGPCGKEELWVRMAKVGLSAQVDVGQIDEDIRWRCQGYNGELGDFPEVIDHS